MIDEFLASDEISWNRSFEPSLPTACPRSWYMATGLWRVAAPGNELTDLVLDVRAAEYDAGLTSRAKIRHVA